MMDNCSHIVDVERAQCAVPADREREMAAIQREAAEDGGIAFVNRVIAKGIYAGAMVITDSAMQYVVDNFACGEKEGLQSIRGVSDIISVLQAVVAADQVAVLDDLLAGPLQSQVRMFLFGSTPLNGFLIQAAANDCCGVVERLLRDPSIDVNNTDGSGRTALSIACNETHVEIVKLLLAHPAIDPNKSTRMIYDPQSRLETPLEHAVNFAKIREWDDRSLEVLRLLLAHPKTDANVVGHDGVRPLVAACAKDHHRVVELLLKTPAIDVHQSLPTDPTSFTSLLFASQNGHHRSVALLLAHPAIDVNRQCGEGRTALLMAAFYDHVQTVELLLVHPAIDVDRVDDLSCTPLLVAAERGYVGTVAALVAAGADLNARQSLGATALMLAAHGGHVSVVNVLVAAGADVHATRSNGESALMLAARGVHTVTYEGRTLERKEYRALGYHGSWNCDVCRKSKGKQSPLYHDAPRSGEAGGFDICLDCVERLQLTKNKPAARGGHVGVVDALVAAGAQAAPGAQMGSEHIAKLAGPGAALLAEQLAHAIASGASEQHWGPLEVKCSEIFSSGWHISQAVGMMRHMGVRDSSILTEGIDPRSAQVVRQILGLVTSKEVESRGDPGVVAAGSTSSCAVVVLKGLIGAAEHNGMRATVLGFAADRGRFTVELQGPAGGAARRLQVKLLDGCSALTSRRLLDGSFQNVELASVPPNFVVGVGGLVRSAQHNGKWGTVVGGPDAETGRYKVRLEEGGQMLGLKLQNLRLVEAMEVDQLARAATAASMQAPEPEPVNGAAVATASAATVGAAEPTEDACAGLARAWPTGEPGRSVATILARPPRTSGPGLPEEYCTMLTGLGPAELTEATLAAAGVSKVFHRKRIAKWAGSLVEIG
jgi:ankyrin repeat protein